MKNNYQENMQEKFISMLVLYLEINNLSEKDIESIYQSDAKLTDIYCYVCRKYSLFATSRKVSDKERLQIINSYVEEVPLEAIRLAIREKYPTYNLSLSDIKRVLKKTTVE